MHVYEKCLSDKIKKKKQIFFSQKHEVKIEDFLDFWKLKKEENAKLVNIQ